MDLLWDALKESVRLLVRGDRDVWDITVRSLMVSGFATLVSLIIGVPLGMGLALGRLRARTLVLTAVNTGMGLPPVVVGLVTVIMLWRTGPLGDLHLLYTWKALVIAQAVLSLPVIVGFTAAAVQSLDPRLRLQLLGLGASRLQMVWLLVREARILLLAAVMAGFGAAISEVGASMQVGGNIQGRTRILTTTVVLESGRGNFDVALALGIILLCLTFLITLLLTILQQRAARR
ncbi:MAG: ABC transporter permease [Chloroflexi bacterium]|nr:ABC transporter permease [Chloroflexota bacterium]